MQVQKKRNEPEQYSVIAAPGAAASHGPRATAAQYSANKNATPGGLTPHGTSGGATSQYSTNLNRPSNGPIRSASTQYSSNTAPQSRDTAHNQPTATRPSWGRFDSASDRWTPIQREIIAGLRANNLYELPFKIWVKLKDLEDKQFVGYAKRGLMQERDIAGRQQPQPTHLPSSRPTPAATGLPSNLSARQNELVRRLNSLGLERLPKHEFAALNAPDRAFVVRARRALLEKRQTRGADPAATSQLGHSAGPSIRQPRSPPLMGPWRL